MNDPAHRTEKPRLAIVRTITMWARYRPSTQEIVEAARYRYQLAVPSRDSGDVLVQLKGHYVRQRR